MRQAPVSTPGLRVHNFSVPSLAVNALSSPLGGTMLSFLERGRFLGLLALRLVLGIIMIAHGYPKIFGGIHGHLEMVGRLGLPPWLGYFSAGTEFFGGVLLMVGLPTRIVSIAFVIEMLVAIAKVHWKAGLNGQGG